jgi:hypothetical protein
VAAAVFAIRYAREPTVSIDSITTPREVNDRPVAADKHGE